MKVVFLVPYPVGESPGQRFRFEQWLRLLPADAIEADIRPLFSVAAYRHLYAPSGFARKTAQTATAATRRVLATLNTKADVAFVYRELFPLGPAVLESRLARRMPFVFDFDDAIWLGDTSPANAAVARLKRPAKVADTIAVAAETSVGSGFLEGYARQHSDRVQRIPTTLDVNEYTPPSRRRRTPGERLRVGWSGSPTTSKHLLTIESALRRMVEELPVDLVVMGDPGFELCGAPNVTVLPWSRESEREVVSSFDVGLMPLPDDEWSRGKCGFKALLYMSMGVPTVLSPVGANLEIVTHGENGIHASTTDEWFDAVTRLVEDEAAASEIGSAGRQTVVDRYSGQHWAPVFLDVLERAAQSR